MMNQAMLVGRLTRDPEVVENESGTKYSNLTLAVPRNFKNEDGVYETDFIEITLWNNIAENTVEYTKCGDVIGIKGRVQTDKYQDEEGNMNYVTEIIAEKVTFLSSSKPAEEK